MRIARFRVERYRSIETAESIDLKELTVLVGPNNEGKSNILRALVVGLEALTTVTAWTRTPRPRSGILQQRLDQFESYSWIRDFPIRLQSSTPGAHSMFEFEFALDAQDVIDFREDVGHSLNGELKVRILLGNDGKAQFKIVKRGPGSVGLNEAIRQIAHFIASRIRVEYIPVARTFDQSELVMRREVGYVLRQVASTPEYQAAEATLDRLLAEALRPLEVQVLESVREFLPDVRAVAIHGGQSLHRTVGPDVEIEIDDGLPTSLSAKGDGVQSLVAISLVRWLARRNTGRTYVLAVEEPESHLHPGAVHRLRQVLEEIAATEQVVVTTHSPILVRRDNPGANILVNQNAASPAKSLAAVRDSLGVMLPDNMSSAEVVLLVEGRHDGAIISGLLGARSEPIRQAIREGRLEIRDAGGASSVPYQYRVFRDSICAVHVLLDDDAQGRKARAALDSKEHIAPADATMVSVVGMSESEIEDLLDPTLYVEMLRRTYNVELQDGVTQSAKRFGLRMKDHFDASGQSWTDSVESNVKSAIADLVIQHANAPVIQSRAGVLDALVRALAAKLHL